MSEEISNPLLSLIREQGMLDDLQYEEVVAEIKRTGGQAIQVLQDFGIMKLDDILHVMANSIGTEVVNLRDREISAEILKLVPAKIAQMYRCLPIGMNDGALQVAMAEPLDPARSDEVQFSLKREVQFVVADPGEIQRSIERFYGQQESESFSEILKEIGSNKNIEREVDLAGEDAKAAEALANEVPIVKFVNLVLQQAVQDRASDIHFEPFETEFRIRYRVDGALYEMAPPPKHLALPVISRLKVMANLNISEKRLPQDGRINLNLSGKQVDLRMSTLPTAFGESVVLRVLDRSSVNLEIESLGFPKYVYDFVTEVIQRPNGIFVVTGPTGCGKTTTLYSCLNFINRPDRKIITVEDPVEYVLAGINQVQVNDIVGFTFARALRAILRQAPNIVMIGEIRDIETASIAINASLTGHLVFSTLHTNDAPGAVTRLVDIGVKPFLVASSTRCLMAQRLVRKICKKCPAPYVPTDAEMRALGLTLEDVKNANVQKGRGCSNCNNTGNRGRFGIFEIFVVDDEGRKLIYDQVPSSVLRARAREMGMRTLREDGTRKVMAGLTTAEEVIRATTGDAD